MNKVKPPPGPVDVIVGIALGLFFASVIGVIWVLLYAGSVGLMGLVRRLI